MRCLFKVYGHNYQQTFDEYQQQRQIQDELDRRDADLRDHKQ